MTTTTLIHHVTKLTTSSTEADWVTIEFETDSAEHGSITFFPSTLTSSTELLKLFKMNLDCDLEGE